MIANRFPIATKRLLLPLVEPEDLTTHVPYLLDGVTDQNSGGTALDDLPLLGLNLPSGGSVPYAQHLVQNQNIPAPPGWRWKRPARPALHPDGQRLKGPVLEILELGKLADLSVHLVHELPRIPQHGPQEIGVLPHRQISVKAASQLQQKGNTALPLYLSLCWLHIYPYNQYHLWIPFNFNLFPKFDVDRTTPNLHKSKRISRCYLMSFMASNTRLQLF